VPDRRGEEWPIRSQGAGGRGEVSAGAGEAAGVRRGGRRRAERWSPAGSVSLARERN
jgi:hypothetical protein